MVSVGRRLVIALALGLVLGLSAAPAAGAAAAPRGFFGVGGWAFPAPADLSRLAHDGLRSWRTTLSWAAVEPAPGEYRWSGYDQLVRLTASHRVGLLFTISGCPTWACPLGRGIPPDAAGRTRLQAFIRAAVQRYGHGNRLRLPPVTYWQVGNEVNGPDQWPPRPSVRAYAAYLRRSAQTIRLTDRRARVVLAGLGEKMDYWLRDYLPGLYRRHGFRRSFDIMAVEGYAPRTVDVPRILDLTRRIMRRHHDRKPIWITEMSWATGGPPFPFTTTLSGQARRLTRSWRTLLACRRRWNLRRVYWFAFGDRAAGDDVKDYWGFHNGLLFADGRPKPAFNAFVRFVRPGGARVSRCRLRR